MNKKIIYVISVVVLLLSVLLYYVIRFSSSTIIAQEGYYISKNKIDKELLSTSRKIKTPVIKLERMSSDDTVYTSLGRHYVSNDKKKKELNTRYPIYSNNGIEIINISSKNTLINDKFEEFETYENSILLNNTLYNYYGKEQADYEKYIFLRLEDNIYVNLSKIETNSLSKKLIIPVNSIISFQDNYIKYYTYSKTKKLVLNTIPDINLYTKIKIDKKDYNYEDLLNYIRGSSKQKDDDDDERNNEYVIEDVVRNYPNEEKKFIKPVVKAENFEANVYTATSVLDISDPSKAIVGGINFQLFIDNKLYTRKVFTSSGSIKIKGLRPDTQYHIIGNYKYYNESKKKIEVEFFEQIFKTGKYETLKPIKLSIENGQIYSNKIELKNIKITSDINDEAIFGVQKGVIIINNNKYNISHSLITKLINGESSDYISPESLTSNKKQDYEIILMDNFGNELKIENNTGSTRTAKKEPKVTISVDAEKTKINNTNIKISLKNEDNVNINSYKYVIYTQQGEFVREHDLEVLDKQSIDLKDLNQNRLYNIKIYGNYDILDGKGTRKNVVLGETSFTTMAISSLGYIRVITYADDVTPNSATISSRIDFENTHPLLIELLSDFKIEIKNKIGRVVYSKTYKDEELETIKEDNSILDYLEGLYSNTEYTIEYSSHIKIGTTTEEIKTISGVKNFKTYKKDAYVLIENQFVNNNMIDFDVRVIDEDSAITSNRVILTVTDLDGNLIERKELNINDDKVQIKYTHLLTNKDYTFEYVSEGYNIGQTNATFENNHLIYKQVLTTNPSVVGNIELVDITSQITGDNLFNIKNQDRIRKVGDTGYKEYDIEKNAIMFGARNGTVTFSYYVPEAAGKKVRVKFKAKYDNNSKFTTSAYITNTYKNLSVNPTNTADQIKPLSNLEREQYHSYSFDLLIPTGYIGFQINAPVRKNERTDIWIKDLQIFQISDTYELKESYSKYIDSSDNQTVFTKTEMKSGTEYFKSYEDESEYIKGNEKDGYAIITNLKNNEKTKYSQKNSSQEFIAPQKGRYKVELWGAGGGSHCADNTPNISKRGGKGAYTAGEIELDEGDKLYIYVGSKGADGVPNVISQGGYNGGGNGAHDNNAEGLNGETAGGGGGATDVRLIPGEWNNQESLKSRIMVAGGGGGAIGTSNGGDAGALTSFTVGASEPATQMTGYSLGGGEEGNISHVNMPTAGGGGGYYGGYSTFSNSYTNPGSGGSSYISGHKGCISYYSQNSESKIQALNQKIAEFIDDKDDKYKEDDDYQANISVSLQDNTNAITDKKYIIKILKEDKLVETKEYSFINDKVINEIRSYYLNKNKKYTFILSVNIRNHIYDLDTIEVKTNGEIRQIKTVDDFFDINPSGRYVVVSDLDLRNRTEFIYELFGEIDFQGHSIELNWRTSSGKDGIFEYVRAGSTIKNVVINYHSDYSSPTSWKGPFIYRNYGTVDNIRLNVVEANKVINLAWGIIAYVNYGKIKNFIVNNNAELHIQNRFGLLVYSNYGTIENGYIYGQDIYALHPTPSNLAKNIGMITGVSVTNSIVRNIYVLNSVMKNPQLVSENAVGNAVGSVSYGRIENILSVETTENTNILSQDPNFGAIDSASIKNAYYVSPRNYSSDKMQSNKISSKALSDKNFMSKLLNSNGSNFEIDKFISSNYYPQLKMNSCMPNQEWIPLPKVNNEEAIEVTSMETESVDSNSAVIKIFFNNPNEETIENMTIQSIGNVEILSQENENRKSTVRVKISSPTEYRSKYYITSITYKTKSSYTYTTSYELGKLPMEVTMYYPISSLDDWKKFRNGDFSSIADNFILTNDIDFENSPDSTITINTFSGILNGNNKTIKNILIETQRGLFNVLSASATIENLYVENYIKNSSTEMGGLIGQVSGNVEINNVHIKNAQISANKYIGGIVGYASGIVLKNSSVSNLTINKKTNYNDIRVGGLVGYSSYGYITNCFVNGVDINITAKSSIGIGGIVGLFNTGNIVNAYAIGKIKTNTSYTGGIAGYTTGFINNCWSDIDITSRLDYIGGIVGYRGNELLSNTIVFGNVYSTTPGNTIGRTSGNSMIFSRKNYYWEGQKVDGFINSNSKAEKELSTDIIKDENTYSDLLDFNDSFNYSKLEEYGYPLLNSTEGKLLPNQNITKKNPEVLNIKNIVTEQKVNSGDIVITIDNPNHYTVDSVEFDYLTYNSNDMTIINNYDQSYFNPETDSSETTVKILNAIPNKYYDSYKLTKVNYHSIDNKTKSTFKSSKVNFCFYKEIDSVEKWNQISDDEENYMITSDIDFNNTTPKYNLIVGRLEGRLIQDLEGNQTSPTIKNIVINNIVSSTALIEKLTISSKNLNFENIELTIAPKAPRFSFLNIISYNIGDMENVNFYNINLNGVTSANYVAAIGTNRAQSIRNIKLDGGTRSGYDYTAGFIADSMINDIYNVEASNLTVTGNHDYTGGIVGFRDAIEQTTWYKFKGINLKVTGYGEYIGGLFGRGGATDSIIIDSEVKKELKNNNIVKTSFLGGIAGDNLDGYAYNYEVNNTKVIGKYVNNVGGAFGRARNTYYVTVKNNSEITTTSGNYIGGIQGNKSGYTNNFNLVQDVKINSTSTSGTGGLYGYCGGQSSSNYNAIENVKIIGQSYVGGAIGYGNQSRLYYTRVNTDITAAGNYVGGIYGYINSIDGSSSVYSDVADHIVLENAKVRGNNYVSLFTGYAPNVLPSNFFYYIYLIGDVTSNGDYFGIERPINSTKINNNLSNIRTIYVYDNNKYIRVGDTTKTLIQNHPFLNEYINGNSQCNVNNYNGQKACIKMATEEELKTQSYYQNEANGLKNYFSFSNTQPTADPNHNNKVLMKYYPFVNNVAGQRNIVILPTETAEITGTTNSSYKSKLSSKVINRVSRLPQLNVYSSGIDTINLEFEENDSNAEFKVYENNEQVYEDIISKRTYSFNYNYKNTIKVIISSGTEEKEYIYKPEELQNKVTTIKDKYAYIYNDKLKGNIKTDNKKYIHLYGKYALREDLSVYNIDEEKEEEKISYSKLSEINKIVPLFEFDIGEKQISTYYNYSIIQSKSGNILYDNQLFVANGELEIIDSSTNNIKTTAIVSHVGNKKYVTVLGKDGIIYNLKDDIIFPSQFNNSNIKYMSNSINNESNMVVVMYKTGRVVVFDYRTGSEIIAEKATNDISIFDYIKERTKAKNTSIPTIPSSSYSEALGLKKELEKKPLDETNKKTKTPIEKTQVSSPYITYYNAVKNDYDIINTEELLSVNDDELITENDKIYSSSDYVNFYMKDSVSIKSSDRINIVILLSIVFIGVIITLGLWFINNRDLKKKESTL